MQKLARTNEPQLPTPVTALVFSFSLNLVTNYVHSPKIAVKSQETRCILLKNAFDPTEYVLWTW